MKQHKISSPPSGIFTLILVCLTTLFLKLGLSKDPSWFRMLYLIIPLAGISFLITRRQRPVPIPKPPAELFPDLPVQGN